MGLFASAEFFRDTNNRRYGTLPIPQPTDNDISELLKTWMQLNDAQRHDTAQEIDEKHRYTLLAYAERMASLAVRLRDREPIILGLIALGISGYVGDWRDNATIIALHYDAALRANQSPAETFEEAAAYLAQELAAAIKAFLRRSEEEKSLKAMGYSSGTDAEGFRYRRSW
jgi:hypothetical protein